MMTDPQLRPALRQILSRLPVLPTVMTAVSLLVLLALGVWQLQRMQWKAEIIHTIENQLSLPATPLPAGSLDPEQWRYRKAQVEGRFHHDKEIHLYAASKKGKPGYLVITPLERADGSFVFFNRGWVPLDKRNPETRAQGQLQGTVSLTGIGRKPWTQNTFVADNEPAANIWFYGDLDGMAKFREIGQYAPIFLEADDTPNPGGLPLGGQSRVELRNDHLNYALTWFSLAFALLIVYGFYVAEQHRAGSERL